MPAAALVDTVENARKRSGLAAARHTCYQDYAALAFAELHDLLWDTELRRVGKIERNIPQHSRKRPSLLVDVNAESTHPGN